MRWWPVASLLIVAPVGAAPLATATIDVDGRAEHVEVDAGGTLRVGAAVVALGALPGGATLQAVAVQGVPTIVVADAREAIVVTRDGNGWRVAVRTPVGAVGLDHDYAIEVEARPEGVYRFQSRAGFRRCDGKPARLFAEGWRPGATRFAKLSRIPSEVPDDAPVIAAHVDLAPAPPPILVRARAASYDPRATDAGALGIPGELDDGKLDTFWYEELAGSTGEGQFFTFEPRLAGARASQLRIVPGAPATAAFKATARPRRLAVVSARGAWRIDLPDPAGDPFGTAYVADLPEPIDGCATVVLESTYGPPTGKTAIAELELYAAGERAGGGEALLARAVADGRGGAQAAAIELARRGAAAVAAIDGELARATADGRTRLVRALLAIRDPAIGAVVARAIDQHWIGERDLPDAIAALGAVRGQHQQLHDLAADDRRSLAVRLAAVRALGADYFASHDDLIGRGPRALRHAIIEQLSALAVPVLVALAPQVASPDVWRALTRRARARPDERGDALVAMLAALPAAADYELRYRLVDGIATLGDDAALHALDALIGGREPEPRRAAYRHVAALALAQNPRPEAFALVVVLAGDRDPGVRLAALAALATSDGGPAGPWHPPAGDDGVDRIFQTALAADRWPEVRRRAAQALGDRCARVGPARTLGDAALRDDELAVRGDALAALVQCKAAGIAALLAKLWDDRKTPLELRQRAVDLAATLGDPALAHELVGRLAAWRVAALESTDALALVQNAAYAVGRLAPRGGGEALVQALDEGAFPEIVAAAATGLGLMGAKCPATAKPKLVALAQVDEPQISMAARRAAALCGR